MFLYLLVGMYFFVREKRVRINGLYIKLWIFIIYLEGRWKFLYLIKCMSILIYWN